MPYLDRLTTRSFRNLVDQEWRPGAGINLVYGANGAGKSSLLEAVYVGATTRSFRTNRLAECGRLGGAEFFVAADTTGDERVRLEVARSAEGKRRAVNGSSGPIVEHLSVLPVVSWTSRDNEVFQGPPAVRRTLMDRGIVSGHPGSLELLSQYRQALDAKRSAIESQTHTLTEWNCLLARSGSELAERRQGWVARLEAALQSVLADSGLDLGAVGLTYCPSPVEAVDGVESLFEALERVSAQEVRRHRVLAGPHRDDLDIRWRNGSVGSMASAGERKALGLALIVAQARLVAEAHSPPLILVDDLDAELDRNRVGLVWQLLAESAQLIAATSRLQVVEELPANSKWELVSGNITELSRQ